MNEAWKIAIISIIVGIIISIIICIINMYKEEIKSYKKNHANYKIELEDVNIITTNNTGNPMVCYGSCNWYIGRKCVVYSHIGSRNFHSKWRCNDRIKLFISSELTKQRLKETTKIKIKYCVYEAIRYDSNISETIGCSGKELEKLIEDEKLRRYPECRSGKLLLSKNITIKKKKLKKVKNIAEYSQLIFNKDGIEND